MWSRKMRPIIRLFWAGFRHQPRQSPTAGRVARTGPIMRGRWPWTGRRAKPPRGSVDAAAPSRGRLLRTVVVGGKGRSRPAYGRERDDHGGSFGGTGLLGHELVLHRASEGTAVRDAVRHPVQARSALGAAGMSAETCS